MVERLVYEIEDQVMYVWCTGEATILCEDWHVVDPTRYQIDAVINSSNLLFPNNSPEQSGEQREISAKLYNKDV